MRMCSDSPSAGSSPSGTDRCDGIEQGAFPVPLEESPTGFNRIVFAAIRIENAKRSLLRTMPVVCSCADHPYPQNE
jgi:hypothetical protein